MLCYMIAVLGLPSSQSLFDEAALCKTAPVRKKN